MKEPINTEWFMSLLMDLEVKPKFTELCNLVRTRIKKQLRVAFYAWLEDRSELTYAKLSEEWGALFATPLWRILYTDCDKAVIKGVQVVHQICAYSLKTYYETSTEQNEEALRGFFERNRECALWRRPQSEVLRRARSLIHNVLKDLSLDASAISHDYRDGPGAIFEKDPERGKGWLTDYYQQMSAYYPADTFWANVPMFQNLDWFRNTSTPVWRATVKQLATADTRYGAKLPKFPQPSWASNVAYLAVKGWARSRLTVVPKDCSGPRLVFTHPAMIMRAQRAQGIALSECIQRRIPTIRFDDQSLNGHKAVESSYSKDYATIDLSDASDRIPLSLVSYLLPRRIFLRVMSTRTHYVDCNGQSFKLHMFAPMGNAICFPMQTLVFWAIATAATSVAAEDRYDWRPSERFSWLHRYSAHVFGDDIIIPSYAYRSVVHHLETCNLKVSMTKSFVSGFFRESCGFDAFSGTVITPLRQKFNADIGDLSANSFMQVIAFANRIAYSYPQYKRLLCNVQGYIHAHWRNVGYTTDHIRNPAALLTARPMVKSLNRSLAWSYSELHYDVVRSLSVAIKTRKVATPDWCGLNDWFFHKEGQPVQIEYREDELCFRLVWANLFDEETRHASGL